MGKAFRDEDLRTARPSYERDGHFSILSRIVANTPFRPMKYRITATVRDILQQRCPRCRMGRIYRRSILRGFPKMFERCPVCDLRFEREEGYFMGAMYISYLLALGTIAVIGAVLWAVTGWWITKATVWAVVLFLPLAPAITFFARVLWIYLDQTFDPDQS